jgi:hypothetical protein
MAFQRNHVGDLARLLIGLGVYLHKGIYGYVSGKATEYGVSRWFIYYCYFQFLLVLENFPATESRYQKEPSAHYRSLEESVVSAYLDCESSVSGVQRLMKSLFGKDISMGKISQTLNECGALLPSGERGIPIRLKFLSDEIFGSELPVLVTVEPQSIYILQLELVESRDKESWGICWLEIVDNDTEKVGGIAADQGTGLVGGIELVFSKQLYQSDLFHVITGLAYLLWIFEKRAYAQIAKAEEACGKFEKAKSEAVLEKRLAACESAEAEAKEAIAVYDQFSYLFRELQQILEIIDIQRGDLRNKTEVNSQIEAILRLMEGLNHSKIAEAVASFRKAQDDLLKYFDEVQIAEQFLKAQIGDEFILSVLLLIYGYRQKSYLNYGWRQKHLKREIGDWQQALCEWISEAEFQRCYELVEQSLCEIVRSSSLVENVNSRLRRFFDSARGQVNQNRLNLVRFYLNHKVFTRGKRAEKSPAQLFHQKCGLRAEGDEQQHWLDILRVLRAEKDAA